MKLLKQPPHVVPEMFTMTSAGKACGPSAENEDCSLVDRSRMIVGVFDGVGGRGNGRLASRLAAQTIHTGWKQYTASALPIQQGNSPFQFEAVLQQLIINANHAIHEHNEHLLDQKLPATTVVLAVFVHTSESVFLSYASVGDSRLYLLRKQQPLQRLTEDDGYFAFALKKEILKQEDIARIEQATTTLSEEDFRHFKRRNKITCALGWEEFTAAHTGTIELIEGDHILLCTDGIHDNLTDQEIEDMLSKGSYATSAQRLVRAAYQRSQQEHIRAKQDDLSAVTIWYQDNPNTVPAR